MCVCVCVCVRAVTLDRFLGVDVQFSRGLCDEPLHSGRLVGVTAAVRSAIAPCAGERAQLVIGYASGLRRARLGRLTLQMRQPMEVGRELSTFLVRGAGEKAK